MRSRSNSAVSILTAFTAVGWLVFAIAGVAGLRLQYQQAQVRAKVQPPVVVEKLDVRLIGSAAVASSGRPAPLPPSNPQPPPPVPNLPTISEPASTVQFTAPAKLPPRIVQVSVSVEHLVFGTGEGDKPAPEYPREAKIARQQGSVVVRFTVDETGNVTSAEASVPSPYALLNQAAVRAVRDTWHFSSGKPRIYDVTIEFELHAK